jgi:type I restriction enzyme, S subunit
LTSDWKETKLVDVCSDIDYGYTESASYEIIGPKFLRITDIQGGIVNWDTVPYCSISDKDFQKFRLVQGDIVVARTGNSTGENYIFSETLDCVFASFMIRFRVNPSIVSPKFVWYIMRSYYWSIYIDAVAIGAAQKGANSKLLGNFTFSYPKISTQEVIVNNLSTIDALIQEHQTISKCMNRMISTIFRSWFIDFDPVNSKAEDKLPYGMNEETAALFPDSFQESEFGPIPTDWKWGYLGDCVSVVGGGTPSTKNEDFWGGKYNWTSPKDLSNSTSIIMLDTERTITEAGLAKISSGLLPINTVLMSSRAPIGYLALTKIPIAINQGYIAIPQDNGMSPNFILSWIHYNMPLIEAYSSGATFPEISKKEFRKLPILIPPSKLIEIFNERTKYLYDSIENRTKQINSLKRTRDSLLPRLMSGELKVN